MMAWDTQEPDENGSTIVSVFVFVFVHIVRIKIEIKTEKILYITTLKQFDIKTNRRKLPIFFLQSCEGNVV